MPAQETMRGGGGIETPLSGGKLERCLRAPHLCLRAAGRDQETETKGGGGPSPEIEQQGEVGRGQGAGAGEDSLGTDQDP